MKKLNLSVVILAKNEEKNIQRAIRSLSFSDEIIVINDNSTDRTVEIAEKEAAKVISHELTDFSSSRTYGEKMASHDWILHVDADEEISPELASSIEQTIEHPDSTTYRLKRRDYFWDKPVVNGELKKAAERGIVRLYKRGAGKWKGEVHEEYETQEESPTLDGYLNHYPHQTIAEFVSSVNSYSTKRAQELLKQGKKTNAVEVVFYPFSKVVLTYFLYRGYADGAAGFVYSFMMSFHSFLVRAKLYQYTHYSQSAL